MRIAMIGTGYVGLVSGACFSEFGVTVTCVDKDAAKIARLAERRDPDLRAGPRPAGGEQRGGRPARLHHRPRRRGRRRRRGVHRGRHAVAARRRPCRSELCLRRRRRDRRAGARPGYTVVVTKSTVPVGTGRQVAEHHPQDALPDAQFDVASNPEFLREGSAIEDFMRPDRVVIGADSEHARSACMRELYRPLYLLETPILFTALETAELIKYAANAFSRPRSPSSTRSPICARRSAPMSRTSPAASASTAASAANSCMPARALAARASPRTAWRWCAPRRMPTRRCRSSRPCSRVNDARKARMAERIVAACGGSVAGKTLAVLGLTFKPNTDDMRDSPSLAILPALQRGRRDGPRLRSRGHGGGEEAAAGASTFCADAYEAMDGRRRAGHHHRMERVPRARSRRGSRRCCGTPTVIDLRNIYKPDEMAAAGLDYYSIGRAATARRALRPQRASRGKR